MIGPGKTYSWSSRWEELWPGVEEQSHGQITAQWVSGNDPMPSASPPVHCWDIHWLNELEAKRKEAQVTQSPEASSPHRLACKGREDAMGGKVGSGVGRQFTCQGCCGFLFTLTGIFTSKSWLAWLLDRLWISSYMLVPQRGLP